MILLTIFGTVIFFAVRIFQQWILDKVNNVASTQTYVYDSTTPQPGSSKLIGRAIGFSANQEPLVIYHPSSTSGLRAILGVRADGFTSLQGVYFTEEACSGTAMVLDATQPAAGLYGTPIASIYALQSSAGNYNVYAMRDGNLLLRSLAAGPPGAALPESVFLSERYDYPVTAGVDERCYDINTNVATGNPDLPAGLLGNTPTQALLINTSVEADLDLPAFFTPPFWIPISPASGGVAAPATPPGEGNWPAGWPGPSNTQTNQLTFTPGGDETTTP